MGLAARRLRDAPPPLTRVSLPAVPRYRFGRNTIVRCRQGHLFSTIWIPFGSFKAIRLGTSRLQRCPVGHHWSRVKPVNLNSLTPEELAQAEATKDVRIP